jgi:ribonuclease BN (tRNA processing enzyme)
MQHSDEQTAFRSHGVWCGMTAVGAVLLATSAAAQKPASPPPVPQTQVVLLGTGTPPADPDRSGPATAVVVNGTAYLVDFGAGVVRRAKSAVVDKGIAALDPVKLRVAFVTHLHSDHTVGYPDLILTPWVLGRKVPLEVYGPSGIKAMTEHVMEAYRADFEARTRDRALYTVGAFPEGHAVNAHEVRPGVVYKDANVTVTAFATRHTMESYGYRFDTADRSVVVSGDTGPTQATVDACRGCDVLVHEVLTLDWLSRRPDFHAYAAQHHTTTPQLVELAAKARPKLLVLSHTSLSLRPAVDSERSTPAAMLREFSAYTGQVVVGRDLDVY